MMTNGSPLRAGCVWFWADDVSDMIYRDSWFGPWVFEEVPLQPRTGW
jgi:hypothetical protein